MSANFEATPFQTLSDLSEFPLDTLRSKDVTDEQAGKLTPLPHYFKGSAPFDLIVPSASELAASAEPRPAVGQFKLSVIDTLHIRRGRTRQTSDDDPDRFDERDLERRVHYYKLPASEKMASRQHASIRLYRLERGDESGFEWAYEIDIKSKNGLWYNDSVEPDQDGDYFLGQGLHWVGVTPETKLQFVWSSGSILQISMTAGLSVQQERVYHLANEVDMSHTLPPEAKVWREQLLKHTVTGKDIDPLFSDTHTPLGYSSALDNTFAQSPILLPKLEEAHPISAPESFSLSSSADDFFSDLPDPSSELHGGFDVKVKQEEVDSSPLSSPLSSPAPPSTKSRGKKVKVEYFDDHDEQVYEDYEEDIEAPQAKRKRVTGVVIKSEEDTSLPLRTQPSDIVQELQLDLVGMLATTLVFSPRASLPTQEVALALIESNPSMLQVLPANDDRSLSEKQAQAADIWQDLIESTLCSGPFGVVEHRGVMKISQISGQSIGRSWFYDAEQDNSKERKSNLAPFAKTMREAARREKTYVFKQPSMKRKRS